MRFFPSLILKPFRLALIAASLLTLGATSSASAETIKVGWGALPPFQYQDVATEQLKGPLIDLTQEIAKRINSSAEFVQDSWSMLPTGIASRKYQISLMAETDERKKLVDFSPPLYHTQFTAVTRADSGLKSWSDLNQPGKKIATTTGSGGDEVLTKLASQGRIKAEIVRIKEVGAAILAVSSKAADGYINQLDILSLIKGNQPNFAILDGSFGVSLYGVAVPRNNEALKRRINNAVESIVKDGTMEKVIAQYKIVGAVPGAPK